MTSTFAMITMVTIMLSLNIGMALFQEGLNEVNPSGTQFFDVENSPYANYVQNGTLLVDEDLLPEDEAIEGDTSGNVFTDTYRSIKAWTEQTLAPLNFMANILKQPYGFLVDVGVSQEVALAFGTLWYMIAIIIVVSWWTGR